MTSKRSAASGHVIFVTGVPSAGKSRVARKVQDRTRTVRRLSGDAAIKRLSPNGRSTDDADRLFDSLLRDVKERLGRSNLVVDASLPASYVGVAREHFGHTSMFVLLLVDEDERRARERGRQRTEPIYWDDDLTSLQGSRETYDLVLNTSEMSPLDCADAIVSAAADRWNAARL